MTFKKTKLILISALAMQASFSMAGMERQNPFEGFKTMTMEERREAMRERFSQMRAERKAARKAARAAQNDMPEVVEATPIVDMPEPEEATPVVDMPETEEATPVVDMPETEEETPKTRGESIREQLMDLYQQYRAGELTREEFDAARNDVLGIDPEGLEGDDEDQGGERTSYETESTSTTGVEVTGGLVAQCSAGQFAVSIDVTPETSCTLSQTVKMGEEETVSEETFSGAKVNMIALPANSIASVAATLSCSNTDGTFSGSASASTQSGCTASFPQVDPEVSAERLQEQLDAALASLQERVEADKVKLAEMEEAGEDTAFFKDFLITGNIRKIDSTIKSMTFIFQDRLPAEQLDAALMSFKETATTLVDTI